MTQKNTSTSNNEGSTFVYPLRRLTVILLPSLFLLPVLTLYLTVDDAPYFFLHTLMGWDVGLVLLSFALSLGRSWSCWDRFFILGVSFYALLPDFMYRSGLFYRGWMDIFLFHVALDETLVPALSVLVLLWVTLLVGYFLLLVDKPHISPKNAQKNAKATVSSDREHQLRLFYVVSGVLLIALVVSGLVTERSIATTQVRIGQRAANFALPSTEGSRESLSLAQGHVVLLICVPSVLCDFCRKQLQMLQELLPELQAHDIVVFVVSTDTPEVQHIAAQNLHLDFPLLSEAPSMNQHPAGSAYGVYHFPQQDTALVDANSIIVIDAKGIVRAVSILPNRSITATKIRTLIDTALGPIGVKKSVMNAY